MPINDPLAVLRDGLASLNQGSSVSDRLAGLNDDTANILQNSRSITAQFNQINQQRRAEASQRASFLKDLQKQLAAQGEAATQQQQLADNLRTNALGSGFESLDEEERKSVAGQPVEFFFAEQQLQQDRTEAAARASRPGAEEEDLARLSAVDLAIQQNTAARQQVFSDEDYALAVQQQNLGEVYANRDGAGIDGFFRNIGASAARGIGGLAGLAAGALGFEDTARGIQSGTQGVADAIGVDSLDPLVQNQRISDAVAAFNDPEGGATLGGTINNVLGAINTGGFAQIGADSLGSLVGGGGLGLGGRAIARGALSDRARGAVTGLGRNADDGLNALGRAGQFTPTAAAIQGSAFQGSDLGTLDAESGQFLDQQGRPVDVQALAQIQALGIPALSALGGAGLGGVEGLLGRAVAGRANPLVGAAAQPGASLGRQALNVAGNAGRNAAIQAGSEGAQEVTEELINQFAAAQGAGVDFDPQTGQLVAAGTLGAAVGGPAGGALGAFAGPAGQPAAAQANDAAQPTQDATAAPAPPIQPAGPQGPTVDPFVQAQQLAAFTAPQQVPQIAPGQQLAEVPTAQPGQQLAEVAPPPALVGNRMPGLGAQFDQAGALVPAQPQPPAPNALPFTTPPSVPGETVVLPEGNNQSPFDIPGQRAGTAGADVDTDAFATTSSGEFGAAGQTDLLPPGPNASALDIPGERAAAPTTNVDTNAFNAPPPAGVLPTPPAPAATVAPSDNVVELNAPQTPFGEARQQAFDFETRNPDATPEQVLNGVREDVRVALDADPTLLPEEQLAILKGETPRTPVVDPVTEATADPVVEGDAAQAELDLTPEPAPEVDPAVEQQLAELGGPTPQADVEPLTSVDDLDITIQRTNNDGIESRNGRNFQVTTTDGTPIGPPIKATSLARAREALVEQANSDPVIRNQLEATRPPLAEPAGEVAQSGLDGEVTAPLDQVEPSVERVLAAALPANPVVQAAAADNLTERLATGSERTPPLQGEVFAADTQRAERLQVDEFGIEPLRAKGQNYFDLELPTPITAPALRRTLNRNVGTDRAEIQGATDILPEFAAQVLEETGRPFNETQAVTIDGKMYINRDAIEDEIDLELVTTLAVLGDPIFRAEVGPPLEQSLLGVTRALGTPEALVRRANELDIDIQTSNPELVARATSTASRRERLDASNNIAAAILTGVTQDPAMATDTELQAVDSMAASIREWLARTSPELSRHADLTMSDLDVVRLATDSINRRC